MIVLAKKLLSDDEIGIFQHSSENSSQLCATEIQKIAHTAAQCSANLLLEIINKRQITNNYANIIEKKQKKSICNLV